MALSHNLNSPLPFLSLMEILVWVGVVSSMGLPLPSAPN